MASGEYNTGQLATMEALHQKWGWHEGVEHARRSDEESVAMKQYCTDFGKFPPGVKRDSRRWYRRIWVRDGWAEASELRSFDGRK